MPAIKIGFVNFGLTFRMALVNSLTQVAKSFRACGQSKDGKIEDIHCLKKGEKAEEAFAGVSEFWDKDLEYFEALTTAESQLILADNHHFENNDLFVIDE